jgi:hypothetical protein
MPSRAHLLAALALTACGGAFDAQPAPPSPSAPSSSPAPALAPRELDPRFASAIEAVGRDYQRWGRVLDRASVAIAPCAPAAPPPHPYMSRADESPHGQKVFYLWSSDAPAYTGAGPIPDGFAIVKESFRAVPAATGTFTAGEPTGLFVITKTASPDGTDAGWIYGTIVDGKVITAGNVARCAGCHEHAHHERLFGLPPQP